MDAPHLFSHWGTLEPPEANQVLELDDLAKIWISDNPLRKMRDIWMVEMEGQIPDAFQSMDTLDSEARKYVNGQLLAKYLDFSENPDPEVAAQIKATGPRHRSNPAKTPTSCTRTIRSYAVPWLSSWQSTATNPASRSPTSTFQFSSPRSSTTLPASSTC